MPVEMAMKKEIGELDRGRATIHECERRIEQLIVEETSKIEDMDTKLEAYRKLKRKAWYMLLKTTRRCVG